MVAWLKLSSQAGKEEAMLPADLETFAGLVYILALIVVVVIFYLLIHSAGDI